MLEVLAYANTRTVAGALSTYQFVLDRGQKKVSDMLKSVWDMESPKEKLERPSHTHLELLQLQLKEPCVCEGQWLSCALEILHNNDVEGAVFSEALFLLWVEARAEIYIYVGQRIVVKHFY